MDSMKPRRQSFRYGNVGYLFVLPAALYMVLLVGYPIVSNFVLSFQDVTTTTLSQAAKPFVGLRNYADLFADGVLRTSVGNTFLFTLGCLVLQFGIGFALALFFNRESGLAKTVRGVLMVPWMIPMTVTALMFKFMFSSNVGIVNQVLQGIGAHLQAHRVAAAAGHRDVLPHPGQYLDRHSLQHDPPVHGAHHDPAGGEGGGRH